MGNRARVSGQVVRAPTAKSGTLRSMRFTTPKRRIIWALTVAALFAATAVPSSAVAASPSYTYVALGDSYTAGPLIPNLIPEAGACVRSDHDYPHLVATVLDVSRFRDVSCSGATTANMTQPQVLPFGAPNGPQLDALDAGVDLVSLGIGGNDSGLIDVLLTCIGLGLFAPFGAPCQQHYAQQGDDIGARVEATASRIAAVLAAIHERAPRARVLVVGYPVVLPHQGPGCWPLVPIAFGDVPWLRDLLQRLNAVLATAAAAGGAIFVDTYQTSIGHDVCALPGVKWVEGLIPTAPAAPLHPNFLGVLNSAQQVLLRVQRLAS
jgi:lysophospholipase L1-like esterase